jgi:hypothetical protein
MASNFYRAEDAPRYLLGHALEAHNEYTPEELGALGDRAITFKYFL